MTILNNIKSIIALPLVILLSSFSLSAENEDVNIVIPFQLVNGLIIMQAEVDGVVGDYILDTGANTILIDGQPQQTDHILTTPEGEVEMAYRQLEQLSIGSFTQYEINAQVISLNSLKEQLGIELDGIIGGGYFMPNALTLDFSKSVISVSSAPLDEVTTENLNALEVKMVNDIPVVEVEIEEITYNFAMDSGASVHFMEASLLKELASAYSIQSTSQVLTVNQVSTNINRYLVNKFTLGSANYSGHHFLSQDFEAVNLELDLPIAGILSLSQLTRHKIILDFKNLLIYF